MELPVLDVDASIEKLIKKAKSNFGSIAASDLGDDDIIKGIYYDWMREKMLQYKLIEKTKKGFIYSLTERGWQFESFTREDEIAELGKQKLKHDAKNAERIFNTYWVTFGLALGAFLISLFLAILKIAELTD